MDFSVIVPCYNAARFVGGCLDSIAAQSLPACEIIGVDDGSSDASCDLVAASPLPVRLLQTDRRGGAGARNAGIAAAAGEWVAFLDADDVWYPNHLERAAEIIREYAPKGYINHYDRIDPTGDGIQQRRCRFDSVVSGVGLDEYVGFFAQYGHFVGMSACMVETRRAREIGGLCEEQKRRHDIEFWLRVVAEAPWVFDPLATSAYRKNSPGGLSEDAAEAAFYGFQAFLRHRDAARDRAGFDAVLRERARSAIARSFASDDVENRERAFSAAYDHLGRRHKLAFRIARRFPALLPAFRALKLA